MCSADAFAMNPQDAFPNFLNIESRFAEMDTLLSQTRSLFSHLEMRISHIEGRLQAVENMFHPEEEEDLAPANEKVVSFTRVHPYRVALVGSVCVSALVVATVLHSRDGHRVASRSLVAQAAVSTAPTRAPLTQATLAPPLAATTAPIHETKTASFPIVSHVTANETPHATRRVRPATLNVVPAADPNDGVSEKLHQVVRGDSLTSIARDHGIHISQLIALNPMKDPNKLAVGQRIRIPLGQPAPQRVEPVAVAYDTSATQAPRAPRARLAAVRTPRATRHRALHLVEPGDTFYRLSIRYGIPLQTLMRHNPNLNPRRLLIAQQMVLPAGYAPRPRTALPADSTLTPRPTPARRAVPIASLPLVTPPPTLPLPTPGIADPGDTSDGFTTEVVR